MNSTILPSNVSQVNSNTLEFTGASGKTYKIPCFSIIATWVSLLPKMTHTAYKVLQIFAASASRNNNFEVFRSVKSIADMLHIKRDQVRGAIKILTKLGLIADTGRTIYNNVSIYVVAEKVVSPSSSPKIFTSPPQDFHQAPPKSGPQTDFFNKEFKTTTYPSSSSANVVDPSPIVSCSSSFSSSDSKNQPPIIQESQHLQAIMDRLEVVEQALKDSVKVSPVVESIPVTTTPIMKPPVVEILTPVTPSPEPTVKISNENVKLVLPPGLDDKHKTSILKMLNNKTNGQLYLDEMAQRMDTVRNPVGYISKLIQLDQKDMFHYSAEKSVAETSKQTDINAKIERWKNKKYDYAFHQTAEFIALEKEIGAYYHEIGHHAPDMWRSFN